MGREEVFIIYILIIIFIVIILMRKFTDDKHLDLTSNLNKKGYSLRRINGSWLVYDNNLNLVFKDSQIGEIYSWYQNASNFADSKYTDKQKIATHATNKGSDFKQSAGLYEVANKVSRSINPSRKWDESKVIVFMRGLYEEFQRLTKKQAKRASEAAVKIVWIDGDERLHPATVAIKAFCKVLKYSNDVNELIATLEVVVLMTQHYEHDDFQKQLKVIDRRLLTTGFEEAGEIALERGISRAVGWIFNTRAKVNAAKGSTGLDNKTDDMVTAVREQLDGFSTSLKIWDNWSLGYAFGISTAIARGIYKLDPIDDASIVVTLGLIYDSNADEAMDISKEIMELDVGDVAFQAGMKIAFEDANQYRGSDVKPTSWKEYLGKEQ